MCLRMQARRRTGDAAPLRAGGARRQGTEDPTTAMRVRRIGGVLRVFGACAGVGQCRRGVRLSLSRLFVERRRSGGAGECRVRLGEWRLRRRVRIEHAIRRGLRRAGHPVCRPRAPRQAGPQLGHRRPLFVLHRRHAGELRRSRTSGSRCVTSRFACTTRPIISGRSRTGISKPTEARRSVNAYVGFGMRVSRAAGKRRTTRMCLRRIRRGLPRATRGVRAGRHERRPHAYRSAHGVFAHNARLRRAVDLATCRRR